MAAEPRPRLSVLIAAWNAAGSIERTVASVLEATDVDLECVVVDDGSTDGTAEIVRGIAMRDPRVVAIALPDNVGVSEARNRGLAAARGDWLTILDADDRFLPGGLATLARAALGADALAVIGQQVWWDGRRHWITAFYDNPDIRRPGRKSLADSPGLLRFVSPHAKLLHRSTWEDLRFSGRVLGDQPWVIRALLRAGDRIDVLSATVYEWYRPPARQGVPSITMTTRATIDRGLEAIEVARAALAEVAAEAEGRLDARTADALQRAYVARILRMDLAQHVANALGRADPDIGRLFDAVRELLAGLDPGHLAATDALARAIVEPPLMRWGRVPAGGRERYWRLFDAALALDPGLPRHASGPVARLALRRLAKGRGPAHRWFATTVLAGVRLADGLARLLRQGRGSRRPARPPAG